MTMASRSSSSSSSRLLPPEFYSRPTPQVAHDLIGKVLVRVLDKKRRLAGVIVETEAYGHADDPASHAHRGPTARNRVMFGPVGVAYVYFTYGSHHCVNVSARSPDRAPAGAVLIRSIEPVEGVGVMQNLRGTGNPLLLASGPGRLTQAMGITLLQNGLDMTVPGSGLCIEEAGDLEGGRRQVVSTPRIGITKAADLPWRFVDPSSRFVSRRLPAFAPSIPEQHSRSS